MTNKPKYCAECGALLETRILDKKQRSICSGCRTVFYQNPIPVAACIVVNKKRELLLVKRALEPKKGEWCLPMGFAERGETIQESALRELMEEAGIKGQILNLVDVYSSRSDMYGDLLTVTFEVRKIGGRVQAGDDAEDVGWFPLDRLPNFAFRQNKAAVRIYKKTHPD